MKMKGRACELCNQHASLYCPSDAAFLCSNCDATVHQANFLVARHLRHLLCYTCNRFTGNHISGAISPRVTPTCRSCTPLPSSSSSSSSSCLSSSKSPNKIKVRRFVAEEVFVKWSREIGLGVKGDRVASLASHALGFCVGKWRAVPSRVAAATSFWLALRFSGDRSLATFQNLTRLEATSGVPAKLILAAHAKLARVFTHRRAFRFQDLEQERWDES